MFGKRFFANKYFGGRYWGKAVHFGIVLLGGGETEDDGYSYIQPWQAQQPAIDEEINEPQPVDRLAELNAYAIPASTPLIANNADEISARQKARLIRQHDDEEAFLLFSMPFIN